MLINGFYIVILNNSWWLDYKGETTWLPVCFLIWIVSKFLEINFDNFVCYIMWSASSVFNGLMKVKIPPLFVYCKNIFDDYLQFFCTFYIFEFESVNKIIHFWFNFTRVIIKYIYNLIFIFNDPIINIFK